MSRTLIGVMLVGALALGGACGKKDKDAPKKEPAPKTTEQPPEPEPPKDLSPEERVAFFNQCWAAFNAQDEAKFAACYTDGAQITGMDQGPTMEGAATYLDKLIKPYWAAFPDIKGTPQLTLVSGNRIISVEHMTGTNKGEFMGMPATDKTIGHYFLHDLQTSGPGPVEVSNVYSDQATVMGQLGHSPAPHREAVAEPGEPVVVIAADDEKEQANLEIAKKTNEAFNAHDVDAVTELYADDVLFRDMTMPADIEGKKAMTKGLKSFYKAFPDIKAEYGDMIAAGDYVAMFSTMTGTNKGPMKDMGLKKPTGKTVELHGAEVIKIEDGKVTEHWMFANGMAFAIQLGLIEPPAAPEGGAGEEGGEEGGEQGGDEETEE